MMLTRRILWLSLLLLIVASPVSAQDAGTVRDPWALAERLLGYDAGFTMPPPTPLYQPGDSETFWVTKASDDQPTQINATLVATTPALYLWVEDDLTFAEDTMAEMTQQLGQVFLTLRLLGVVYGDPTIIPRIGEIQDTSSLIEMPDVDNDPHLFLLFASDLGERPVVINTNDSLPMAIAPGDYSNQHELLAVNTSVLPDAPLDNPAFITIAANGFYEFLAHHHTPDQAQWLKGGLAILLGRLMDLQDITGDLTVPFLQNPNASLSRPASLTIDPAVNGGQQLFFDYALQRFDFPLFQSLFRQPGAGLAAFDRALADLAIVDPVTATIITGPDVFADFVVANAVTPLLNGPFGDTRHWHFNVELPEDTPPPADITLENRLNTAITGLTVNQFGTRYVYVSNDQPSRFTVSFAGQPTTARLPLPLDADPANRFYWSGDGADQDTALTRLFDLTAVDSATLQFDTWYQLQANHNYAYVEVSTDDGATWAIVPGDLSSGEANRYGLAYGPGYTGLSNPEGPKPFPTIGILFDSGSMTVTETVADGPASHSDLRAQDVIIGFDSQMWPGQPDLIGLLANYAPDDTLNLYIQRGDERLDVPIVLGSRIIQPEPIWVAQEINLSDYAGQEIQVRFEYISQPGTANAGVAIDNIAIREIDYNDDAEGDSDWTLHGWQQIDNRLRQNFLVQYISNGSATHPPRVRQLIGPDDEALAGDWHFQIEPDEIAIFAVSGLNANTHQPATFDLVFSPGT